MYVSSKSAPEMQCPQQEEGVALRGLLKIVPVRRKPLQNICIHQCVCKDLCDQKFSFYLNLFAALDQILKVM